MNLQRYWADQGCVVLQPYDNEVGAGTFHTATTLRALGPDAVAVRATCSPAAVPPTAATARTRTACSTTTSSRCILKPSPDNVQDLYLDSLRAIGIPVDEHDVRFVEDDWESPTLGAWGLGWEVWIDGMEVTQFTYFQQVGGFECRARARRDHLRPGAPDHVHPGRRTRSTTSCGAGARTGHVFTYGDVFLENEREFSAYNFEVADTQTSCSGEFDRYEAECNRVLAAGLPLAGLRLAC